MKLVFFGSGAFGLPTLRRLQATHEVVAVITQPDRPAGRSRLMTATPIAEYAAGSGVPIFKAERVNLPSTIDEIRSLSAEAWVVIAFGQKLGAQLLQGTFAINLHASLLPKYRGAAPINWAMINNERETGVTVIGLADRMDAGDILAQASTPIDPAETAGELHDRLAAMGPDLIVDVLERFRIGRLQPVKQDESEATAAPKLAKSDGTVSFDQAAELVRARVHGLTPWPGCTVKLSGRTLRLARVAATDGTTAHADAGIVLEDRTIACRTGSVRLLEVQAPGGRLMSFVDYCRGQPVSVGARCEPL